MEKAGEPTNSGLQKLMSSPPALHHVVVAGSLSGDLSAWGADARGISADVLTADEASIAVALGGASPETGILVVQPDAAAAVLDSVLWAVFGLTIFSYPPPAARQQALEELRERDDLAVVGRIIIISDEQVETTASPGVGPRILTTAGIDTELTALVARGALRPLSEPRAKAAVTRRDLNLAVRTIREDMQHVSREAASIPYLYERLGPLVAKLRAGGWAATYESLAVLADIALEWDGPLKVIEFGGGSSTLCLARCLELRDRAGDRLVSVDHDAHYLEQTRRALRSSGLEQRAELVWAPLGEDKVGAWYGGDELGSLDRNPAGLVFVDGPPRALGDRLRAAEFVAGRVDVGSMIVVDDSDDAVVAAWVDHRCWHEYEFQIEIAQRSQRSVVLAVRSNHGRQ